MNARTNKTTTGYTYDALNDSLTITEAFAKRASVMHSAEYEIILEFRATHPGRPINLADKKTSNNRPLKLSFKQMGEFIAKCRDAEARTARFEQIKALSKVQPSPYAYVKTWFLDNYANYSEQPEFDADNFVIVKTKSEMEAEAKATAETEETATEHQAAKAVA
jgi:hypothetical protein